MDVSDWVTRCLKDTMDEGISRMQAGLAILASIGSTAPFVGLFGTVWGIYHALLAIGATGQTSIDQVAGPVGESLIMTAFGLFVAIPAVLGYNALTRANKGIASKLRRFAHGLHAYFVTGARLASSSPRDACASRRAQAETRSTMAMNTGFSDDDDDGVMSEINMTPLVDVMLVLLIIFLVTIPAMQHAVKIDLPHASSQPVDEKPQTVDVAIQGNGTILWNDQTVTREQLQAHIAEAAKHQPQPELHLRADRKVAYERVAEVMSDAQAGGLTKLGFVTVPAAKAK
jgi:biopolymer transport protein ExbD